MPGLKIPNTPNAVYNHKNVSGSSIIHMPKPDLPDCFDHPCGPIKIPLAASPLKTIMPIIIVLACPLFFPCLYIAPESKKYTGKGGHAPRPLRGQVLCFQLIVGMANHNAFLNPPFENSGYVRAWTGTD